MSFVAQAWNFKHNETWALKETRDSFHLLCPFQIRKHPPRNRGVFPCITRPTWRGFYLGWVGRLQWRQSGSKWDNRFLQPSEHVLSKRMTKSDKWRPKLTIFPWYRNTTASCFWLTLWDFMVLVLVRSRGCFRADWTGLPCYRHYFVGLHHYTMSVRPFIYCASFDFILR